MALAGPLANLVLVVIAGVVLRVGFHAEWWAREDPVIRLFGEGAALSGPAGERIALLISMMFTLNLMLFVFNLIPLPPLDGSAIWPLVLSPGALARYQEFRSQPSFVLLGLIVASSVFGRVFWPVVYWAHRVLFWGM